MRCVNHKRHKIHYRKGKIFMDNGINELIAIIQSHRDKAYPNLKGFNRA